MSKKYTILTIGPIYDTILLADKTRALWGASTLFSWISNRIIACLLDKGLKDNIIVPQVESREFLTKKHKAGLFDDRIILKGTYAGILQNAFDSAVDEAIKYTIETLEKNEYLNDTYRQLDASEIEEVKVYLKEYLHSFIVEIAVPQGENPVLYISPFADSAEYQPRFGKYLGKHYMGNLFDRINRSPFKRDIFDPKKLEDYAEDRRFKSVLEMAAWELIHDKGWEEKKEIYIDDIKMFDKIESGEVIKMLQKDFGARFKPFYKYYAIVKSDGDGFGTYVRDIGGDKEKLKKLSQNLFNYLIESVNFIRNSGGMVVYAGGDDLLFFAPVYNDEKTIFSLIDTLDNIFKDHFDISKDEDYNKLSISYGLSINYYKFPLYEALETAYEQLTGVAKNAQWSEEKSKNALAVQMRKHSGQQTRLLLDKGSNIYKKFIELIKEELSETIEIPHSFHYNLEKFEAVIEEIETKEQLEHFFKNEFGLDDRHSKAKNALRFCRDILIEARFGNSSIPMDSDINTFKLLFGILGMIKILRGDE